MSQDTQFVPLKDIHADSEFNCRGSIAPIDVKDLADDIEENGLLQPGVVALYSEADQEKYGFKYKLLAGFRRHAAHRMLQKPTMWVTVRDVGDTNAQRILNLRENVQRKDLTVLEEARALKPLFDNGMSEQDVMRELKVKRGWTQIRKMLLSLPPEVQQEVENKMITQEQIRHLYTALTRGDEKACMDLAKEMKENKIKGKKKNVNGAKPSADRPRARKRPELFDLQDHIRKTMGNNVITRLLAWMAGEISDVELEDDLDKFASDEGINYTRRDLKTYTESVVSGDIKE